MSEDGAASAEASAEEVIDAVGTEQGTNVYWCE